MTNPITRRSFLQSSASLGLVAILANDTFSAEDTSKSNYPIGCFTRPWDQHDYRVALDAIAEAGFKYVGLMTSKSGLILSIETTPEAAGKIADEVRQRELSVLSVYGGDIPVQQSLQAGIEGLKMLIDRCATVNSASLLMGGTGNPDLNDVYYQAIAECCDYAENQGVEITVKPHGGLNATGPQCRKLIEKVGHQNFRLWYDPGNIFYYSDGELDPVQDAATVDGIVTGMCVKDYRHPKEVLLTPGTGRVNFSAVLSTLQNGGFTQGPLVIETLAPGDLKQTLAEARKAKTFVESLLGSG